MVKPRYPNQMVGAKTNTKIMGVINLTPDSFSDGGKYTTPEKALIQAKKMTKEGVDIIDIGGESSKPGATPVSLSEEIQRVIPTLIFLKKNLNIQISIDTYKPEVMELALENKADFINDIYGFQKVPSLEMIANYDKPIFIMHMFENPQTMQKNYNYKDLIADITRFFEKRIEACMKAGIKKENIILDPGFGFGKSIEHNLQLIYNVEEFKKLGFKVLMGLSRKSTISKIINEKPNNCDNGTTALNSLCIFNKADYLRVHDVKKAKQAVLLIEKYMKVNNLY